MVDKKGYFQGGGGVNEPTPKKKKYKSDKAIVVQPRFKEPLYHNYDLYETPGEHSPGAGLYQNMDKYKSVSDFIKKKRERNAPKYKSDDSYIEDDGSITKENKKKKADRRLALLYILIKNAIDFPIDDQIGSDSIMGDSGTYSDSVPIGGYLDKYLPEDDFEGKSPDELDFGRDYVDDESAEKDLDLDRLEQKYLTPHETSLYGLPDGISPQEDLDPNATISEVDQQYGTTDSGNTLYDKLI
jgi:hypothetical protein